MANFRYAKFAELDAEENQNSNAPQVQQDFKNTVARYANSQAN